MVGIDFTIPPINLYNIGSKVEKIELYCTPTDIGDLYTTNIPFDPPWAVVVNPPPPVSDDRIREILTKRIEELIKKYG